MSEAIDPRLTGAVQSMELAAELLLDRGFAFTHDQLVEARETVVQVAAGDAAERIRHAAEREMLEYKVQRLRDWLLSLRHRGETDALWTAVAAYAATEATPGWKMHAAICAFLAEVEDELRGNLSESIGQCTGCWFHIPRETMVRHFDVYLCIPCDAKAKARFAACTHNWEADTDPHGADAQHCAGCGWTVPHHHAAKVFPFVCDGWIQEPVA